MLHELMRVALLVLMLVAPWSRAQPVETLLSEPCRLALAAVQAQEDLAVERHGAAPGSTGTRQADTPNAGAMLPGSALARPAAPAALEAARRRAASLCLTGRADPATPAPSGRLAQPPLELSRPGVASPPPSGRALQPGLAGPSAAVPGALALPATSYRPVMPGPIITGCDAYGCTSSDGTRLNRVGPGLSSPRGACFTQGPWVQCP